jgi:Na+/melibiose symporter-like transporter
MDTWGIIIVLVSGVLYFVYRKRNESTARFALFCAGIGTGLVIGAVWAMMIVGQALGG